MEKELRKNESILKQAGIATIVFCIWSLIKWAAYFISNPDEIQEMIEFAGGGEIAKGIVVGIFISIVAIDSIIRVHIGLKAIRISNGRKCKMLYIIFASLIALFTLYSAIYIVTPMGRGFRWDEFFLSFVVDLSSLLISIELVISAIKVKSIRGKVGTTCN